MRLPVETREKIMLAILNHDTGQVGCLHAFPGSTQNAIHSSMTTGPPEHRPEEATLVDVWCVAYGQKKWVNGSTINGYLQYLEVELTYTCCSLHRN